METIKIIFFRNFLFRTFLIGLLFAILLFLATLALRGVLVPVAMSVFNLEEPEINEMIVAFFLNVRLVLLFLILAPALALHWMVKGSKN